MLIKLACVIQEIYNYGNLIKVKVLDKQLTRKDKLSMFDKNASKEDGIYIANVDSGSIAEEVGLEKGDYLLTINGKKPVDIVDYRLQVVEEELELEVLKHDQTPWFVEVEKDFQEPLGISFDPVTIDSVRTCNNNCVFCFIRQNPPGMRKSIQFRDDDYRLSFLEGNYITLNNLSGKDLRRIIKDGLSPLYVSVHSTRSKVRRKMMRNPAAGRIIKKLRALTRKGIRINGQIVVCPGWNDGEELERTLKDLSSLGAAVESVAVVPVGLTSYREGLPEVRPVNEEEAARTIDMVHRFQEKMLKSRGSRFVFLSDEYYLKAGLQVPEEEAYEDYPQLSNGVGLIRLFWEEYKRWEQSGNLVPSQVHKFTMATGEAFGELLKPVIYDLNKLEHVEVNLETVPNFYFGPTVTVAGLLTGFDLLKALRGKNLGNAVIIPAVMLKEDESVFLDGRSLAEVSSDLGVRVIPVYNLQELWETIYSILTEGDQKSCQRK